MSESVLIIETPSCCEECKLCTMENTKGAGDIAWCRYAATGRSSQFPNTRAPWCPLKDIPENGNIDGHTNTLRELAGVQDAAYKRRIINRSADIIETLSAKLQAENCGGWIPCSERMPEVEQDTLLSLRSLDVCKGYRANTEGMFYVEGEGYVEYENVLAWQPLPESYHE